MIPQKSPSRLIFARNLRKTRLSCGLSQEALAIRSGLHRTYVGAVERGERNISIDNMERLATALNSSVIELLEEEKI
jgi:transcriptional regulator with XRE-family HTH domain